MVLFLSDCIGYLTSVVVLFFMDLRTRRVEIGGIASSANGLWSQIARNLTDVVDGFFAGNPYPELYGNMSDSAEC